MAPMAPVCPKPGCGGTAFVAYSHYIAGKSYQFICCQKCSTAVGVLPTT